jgi:hypothetical protein
LARTGFFKPVHVKSLPAHALRSWISARKKLVGQRVTWKTRSEAWRSCSGFGCLARSPPPSSTKLSKPAKGSRVSLPAVRGLIAARTAVMTAVAAIHADMRRMTDDVTTPSDRLRRNPQLMQGDISRREPFVAGRKALSAGPPGEAEVLPGTAIARARRDSKPKVAYTYRR